MSDTISYSFLLSPSFFIFLGEGNPKFPFFSPETASISVLSDSGVVCLTPLGLVTVSLTVWDQTNLV